MKENLEYDYRYKWWGLFGISILAFTAFLDFTIVNTALPFIQRAFQCTILQLQWVSNIFSIVLSMSMIAVGKFADLWGRKRIFYIGVFAFAIAALGAGFSTNIEMLVFFRGLQGLGASTLFIASAALLNDAFPKEGHAKAISIYTGITGAGLMLGPFFGGILIAALGWKWVFWINLPLIVLGLIFCSFSLKPIKHAKTAVKIDYGGLIFLILGLGSLIYGIIEGAQAGWGAILSWLPLSAGVILLILLVIIEEKIHDPLLDLNIMKDKLILLAVFSCCLAGIVSYVFMFFDPLYLRIIKHLSPFVIGLLVAVIPAAQVIVSFLFSRLIKAFGIANILLFSIAVAFFSVVLHRFIAIDSSLLYLLIPFALLGLNWGLSNTGLIFAVNQTISPNKAGAAIGTIATTWNISGSIFLALSSVFFHMSEQDAFEARISSAYVELSPEESATVKTLLGDPSEASEALQQFAGDQGKMILQFFSESFMKAFYTVTDFNGLIMMIVLIIAIGVRLKVRKA